MVYLIRATSTIRATIAAEYMVILIAISVSLLSTALLSKSFLVVENPLREG